MAHKKLQLDEWQQNVYKKFGANSWLSDPYHVTQAFHWITFYRRNPHRMFMDYLGMKLHLYQSILLYLMFHSRLVCFIAARASAKSWIIAAYAVIRAILYPDSKIAITSGVKEQARLMIAEKIRQDLYNKSPNLRREIKDIYDSQNRLEVTFYNNSSITVVVCSDNALGHRSTVNVAEEAKKIKQEIMSRVISPFRIIRPVPFMMLPQYEHEKQFQEEPTEIFISSSIEDTHWLYKTAKQCFNGMLNGDGSFFMATDYSITLRHNIRTRRQMIDDYHKFDPITWAIEYENAVLRDKLHSYFTHDLVKPCQNLERAFYPRRDEDVLNRTRDKYKVPKLDGEIRIIAGDLAFIDKDGNDKSIYTLIRMIPGITENGNQIYTYQVPYITSEPGRPAKDQALHIRRLYEDFAADYIVLDTRNAGITVYDELSKVLYDGARGVEYGPLEAMNRDAIGKRPENPNAKPVIYCIKASLQFNSNVAQCLKSLFVNRTVSMLVPLDDSAEQIRKINPDYDKIIDPDERKRWEEPYIETMFAVSEIINLNYTTGATTNVIKIYESPGEHKDRYSSLSYGCWFAVQLSHDLLDNNDEYSLDNAPLCVSELVL